MDPLDTLPEPSRRGLLAGLGALVVAASLPSPAQASNLRDYAHLNDAANINAFVGIASDGTVTVLSPAAEMGQGSSTGLAQCVADELDAAWGDVKVLHADEAKAYRFAMIPLDPRHMTGGSLSIRVWRQPMREAGARARAMLVAAAASRWGVRADECTTSESVVRHPSGKEATYGELADDAARQKAPRRVRLKDPSQFTLIGKGVPREDLLGKVTGTTRYGIDVRLPGMLHASTRTCPYHVGKVRRVDAAEARGMPGVRDVLVFDDFVAVVADRWWKAEQAAKTLTITWDDAGHGDVDSASISASLAQAMSPDEKDVYVCRRDGKAEKVLAAASQVLTSTYEVPYLDHATMEPLNCTVHVQADRCDVWVGAQGPTLVVRNAVEITGLHRDQIHVHTEYLGGAYGRKGNQGWIQQALRIATRVDAPVQMLWSREETTRLGRYRPAMRMDFKASVDDGRVGAFYGRVAGDNSGRSYMSPFLLRLPLVKKFLAEGLRGADSPYAYDTALVEAVPRTFHLNVGFWRSVNQTYTVFGRECFVDEIAHALGKDPVDLRRELLSDEYTRLRAVMERCVAEAGWGDAPEGRYQGVAITDWGGSFCAQVVELSVVDDRPRIHRLTAVLDCGIYVNPDQVTAQVMGGALMGLSAALGEAITVEGGRVVQSNFHDYRLLRMKDAPVEVEVHLMDPAGHPPRGVGEPGTPPAAPALCNAIFAATGKRVRTLPIPSQLSEIP